MYNIPAEYNGIDTTDKDTYFYIPIHKTRRHIHGVPKEFLVDYIYNMIDKASWEKKINCYYTDPKYIHCCAIYLCPEKYTIQNLEKNKKIENKQKNKEKTENKQKNKIEEIPLNSNHTVERSMNCLGKICVFTKLIELEKYLKNDDIKKIKIFFHKKRIDNFRLNFPKKSRYITFCPGSCKNSNGLIHTGIPSVEQSCIECSLSYCRECGKIPYHKNELCNIKDLQNTSDIVFENPDLYRKCPGCTTWIEKEEGCDHMKCLCGVHFCYNCRMVLCANDPYFHVCNMSGADPHFRDFPINHPTVQYAGELACKCLYCITSYP
jgi:hypothetical protein